MATTAKKVKLTIGTKPLSAAAQKRVNAALKKTLEAELKREGQTLGGIGARALDISGHGRGSVAKTPIEKVTTKGGGG